MWEVEMWAQQAAERFRAFLHALGGLTTRKDPEGQARRNAAEGEAAQVGLRLEENESKGRPKRTHAGADNNVDQTQ
jgi:hypothetical protein